MSVFKACFSYNNRGRGDMVISDITDTTVSIKCRTGSIDKTSSLINAIPPGIWTGKEQPVVTNEIGMVVDGFGWKYRLWTPGGQWSHYLIHPDGNLPGSLGCIVPIRYNCKWLYGLLEFIYNKQGVLTVDVNETY